MVRTVAPRVSRYLRQNPATGVPRSRPTPAPGGGARCCVARRETGPRLGSRSLRRLSLCAHSANCTVSEVTSCRSLSHRIAAARGQIGQVHQILVRLLKRIRVHLVHRLPGHFLDDEHPADVQGQPSQGRSAPSDARCVRAAPVEIERDPVCLRLLFGKLVENAVEYAPTGGVVRIQAAAP